MRQYPTITTKEELLRWAREVNAAREVDRTEWKNLVNIFISGRKVAKIPTSSADVTAADRQGDFNYDASYLYYAVENAGSLVWRRIASSSW